MKKLSALILILISFGLVSCTTYNEPTYITIDFGYEAIYYIAREYDPIEEYFYVNDIYEINEVRLLTSEYTEIPYEYEYSDNLKQYEATLNEIFSGVESEDLVGINDKTDYENDYYQVVLGPMAELTIYLEATDTRFVLEFSYFEAEDRTIFKLSYYENESLYFHYDFEEQYREQVLELLDLE